MYKTITQISSGIYQANFSDLGSMGNSFIFSIDSNKNLINWIPKGSTPAPTDVCSGFINFNNTILIGNSLVYYMNIFDSLTRSFMMYYGDGVGGNGPNTYSRKYYEKWAYDTSYNNNGRIISAMGFPIPITFVNLSGDSLNTILSDTNGVYNYALINAGNYTLTPTKNNDINKSNGVTAVDIALTQAHILGKNILNSPYKLIAADVNGDGKVTALDIVYMKRLILGIDTTFTNSTTKETRLWAFVDSSYKFADSTNTFPFKDSISYINLNANQTNQTFIGIKLGDVNWDWNPALAKMPSPVFVRPKKWSKQ